MYLFLSSILYPIFNLGPGERIGIWLEGCSRKCPGCMSQHLQDRHPEHKRHVLDVYKNIYPVAKLFTGITISGGEPFEQPEGLTALVELIHRFTALDIMVYTGYLLEELESDTGKAAALEFIDILIDGPFQIHESNHLIWRGSDNQRMHLLSMRAQKYRSVIEQYDDSENKLHIFTENDGQITIVGIPKRGFQKALQEKSELKGLKLGEYDDKI